MFAEIVSTYSEFCDLRDDWNRVYSLDPEATVFLSHRWLDAFIADRMGQWCVVVVRDGGRAVAFLPLRVRTRVNKAGTEICDEFYMAGSFSWADYTGLISIPEYDVAAIGCLGKKLLELHWNRIFFKYLHISDDRLNLLLRPFEEERFYIEHRTSTSNGGTIDKLICPSVNLDQDFDAFLSEKLSANSRQKIRRFLRKIDAADEYSVTQADAGDREQDIDTLVKLWHSKWSATKGRHARRLAERYREILRRADATGCLFLPVLRRDENPLGVLGSFIDREKSELLFFVAGRGPGGNNPPVGLVLQAYSIRWAHQQGLHRYDFLRGNEDYKYVFGATDRHLRFIVVGTRDGKNVGHAIRAESIDAVLGLSRRLEKDGDAVLAGRGYEQILAVQPNHAAATEGLMRLRGPTAASVN